MKVALIGPIRHWYTEWDSSRHREYIGWREKLRLGLVNNGHLVYSPHRAWNGPWEDDAQAVNDHALSLVRAVVNMTPSGIPSPGTDAEMALCRQRNQPVWHGPPPLFHALAIADIVAWLDRLRA